MIYTIPTSFGIFLAYVIPGYLLAGIHYPEVRDLNIFYYHVGEYNLLGTSWTVSLDCDVYASE